MKTRPGLLTLLNALISVTALGLYIATFASRGLMRDLFSRAGYYLIFLLVFAWAVMLVVCLRRYKPSVKSFLRQYGRGLAVCLIICAVVFISVEPRFRVLSDETNMLAVSKSMLYEKRTDNVTMGMWYYNNFYPINREIEKRPLLFPFLTHIIHIIVGYRATNGFVLNFFVLFTLLFLIYAQVKKYLGGEVWASSAAILVASQPVVVQSAACAGFDLLAALFMVICFISLKWFLDKPEAPKFHLLWMNLLMLANVRYEGVIFFAVALGLLFCFKQIKAAYFTSGALIIYFCTPLLLLPTFWQRILKNNSFETDKPAFLFRYFIENNMTFFKSVLNFGFFLPYANILNIIGLSAMAYFVYLFFTGRAARGRSERYLVIISAACIAVNWILYTSYFFGKADHPADSRFFIIFCILLTISAVALVWKIRPVRQKGAYVLAASLSVFLLYHPVSVQDRFSRTLLTPREYGYVMDFLKKERSSGRNFLVITDRPGQYTVWDYGAVDFGFANSTEGLADNLKNHLFENIFVVQQIEYKTLRPIKNNTLNGRFELEKKAEAQIDSECFSRISRVVSISPTPKN